MKSIFTELLSSFLVKFNTKGSFLRSFSITFSGTTASFIVQVLFSPIISRIYGPEAYGEFALYNVIVTNFVMVASLSYNEGLLTQQQSEDYKYLSGLIILSSLLFSILYWILLITFSDNLEARYPQLKDFIWLWFVPIIGLIMVIGRIFNNWNIRNENYNRNVRAGLSSQVLSKISTISYGLSVNPTGTGIILGEFLRVLTNSVFLPTTLVYRKIKELRINKGAFQKLRRTASKLINYPKYIFPGSWLNMLSKQLPVIFIPFYYGQYELGAYAFAGSIVAIPSNLIGKAVKPVFFQKCQKIYNESGSKTVASFTKNVAFHLALICVLPFTILFLFGTEIFSFVFGNDWSLAGSVASLSAIHYSVAFVASPLSSLFYTFKKEKLLLKIQSGIFFSRLFTLLIGFHLELSFLNLVLFYSLINAALYLIVIYFQLTVVRIIDNESS